MGLVQQDCIWISADCTPHADLHFHGTCWNMRLLPIIRQRSLSQSPSKGLQLITSLVYKKWNCLQCRSSWVVIFEDLFLSLESSLEKKMIVGYFRHWHESGLRGGIHHHRMAEFLAAPLLRGATIVCEGMTCQWCYVFADAMYLWEVLMLCSAYTEGVISHSAASSKFLRLGSIYRMVQPTRTCVSEGCGFSVSSVWR